MNAPPNDFATDSKPALRFLAYVADTPGQRPQNADEKTDWIVLSVERQLGGLHRAVLQFDLGAAGKRIEDTQLNVHASKQVEIWALPDPEANPVAIFWGEVVRSRKSFRDGEEVWILEALLLPHHFGDLAEGIDVWDKAHGQRRILNFDLEFNPLIDGVIVGNEAYYGGDDEENPTDVDFSLWIDPESARSDQAVTEFELEGRDALTNSTFVTKWILPTACETLQGMLNPDEAYVLNCPVDEQDFLWLNMPDLEDETLQKGHYLPAYLDALLPKHGYGWCCDVVEHEDHPGEARPQIRIFKRGEGEHKVIPHQAIAETFDATKTEALSVDVLTDLASLANVITGHGSLEEREITIELYRAWPEAKDGIATSGLDKTLQSYGRQNDDVWRKWVGNEAGDYTDTRTAIKPIVNVPDFMGQGVFTASVPKRRPLSDCLTWRNSVEGRTRQPVMVEYSVDDGTTWKRFEDHDYGVLHEELGIYFSDPTFGGDTMQRIKSAGDKARVRVTGTIRGDVRLVHEELFLDESPLSSELRVMLDLSHRFHSRKRVTGGTFASLLSGEYDQADDQAALEDFVAAAGINDTAAIVQAEIPLHGLHFDYQLGDVVTSIDGRNISLLRSTPGATVAKYVQIVGIIWDVQRQQTLLSIRPHDR